MKSEQATRIKKVRTQLVRNVLQPMTAFIERIELLYGTQGHWKERQVEQTLREAKRFHTAARAVLSSMREVPHKDLSSRESAALVGAAMAIDSGVDVLATVRMDEFMVVTGKGPIRQKFKELKGEQYDPEGRKVFSAHVVYRDGEDYVIKRCQQAYKYFLLGFDDLFTATAQVEGEDIPREWATVTLTKVETSALEQEGTVEYAILHAKLQEAIGESNETGVPLEVIDTEGIVRMSHSPSVAVVPGVPYGRAPITPTTRKRPTAMLRNPPKRETEREMLNQMWLFASGFET